MDQTHAHRSHLFRARRGPVRRGRGRPSSVRSAERRGWELLGLLNHVTGSEREALRRDMGDLTLNCFWKAVGEARRIAQLGGADILVERRTIGHAPSGWARWAYDYRLTAPLHSIIRAITSPA